MRVRENVLYRNTSLKWRPGLSSDRGATLKVKGLPSDSKWGG